jgi:hypothetical protein
MATQVRVISQTTTFYPVETDEATHQSTDNMSLRTTLVYLHEQMGEDFQFFTADDLFVVIQQWRGIVFFIQSSDAKFQDVMRIQLQTIREILMFLFGVKFDAVMRRNIVVNNRVVFAQYVDAYLGACESDYLAAVNAIRPDPCFPQLAEHFLQASADLLPEFDLSLLSCVMFHAHRLVARFNVPGAVKFDPETFAMLSIFERVEYETVDEPRDLHFSSAYVTSAENKSMKHKTAFLRIERTPISCTISSTRCAEDSPFVFLVITQNVGPSHRDAKKAETHMKIVDFLTAITNQLMGVATLPPELQPVELLEDLLHYVVIDRTHGTVLEMPADTATRLVFDHRKLDSPEAAQGELAKVKHQLAAYGMSAMMRGFTTMMWGQLDYHFCYELRFEDESGEVLRSAHVFSPPPFNDDTGINYRLITDSLFQTDRSIVCLELFAVYRGTVQVKAALASNQTLFAKFPRRR